MFNNSQFDSVRKMFADQFSRETHGYVYRKGQKGAPIPLSEAERDEFVNNFNKYLRVAIWSLIAAAVGMILLLAWLVREPDSPTGQMAMWGAVVAIIAPYMAIFYWAWYAPARELKHRTPTGNELTKAEARTLGRVDKRDSQLPRVLIQDCFLRSSHGSRGFVGRGVGTDRATAAT